MACLPSADLGPVLSPPWSLQRPLGRALALQGAPVLRAWAPHFFLGFMFISEIKIGSEGHLRPSDIGHPYTGCPVLSNYWFWTDWTCPSYVQSVQAHFIRQGPLHEELMQASTCHSKPKLGLYLLKASSLAENIFLLLPVISVSPCWRQPWHANFSPSQLVSVQHSPTPSRRP